MKFSSEERKIAVIAESHAEDATGGATPAAPAIYTPCLFCAAIHQHAAIAAASHAFHALFTRGAARLSAPRYAMPPAAESAIA